jgi:arylsulfatase A-like enzyme
LELQQVGFCVDGASTPFSTEVDMPRETAERVIRGALPLAVSCLLLALSVTASRTTPAYAASPPNVVILLADDMRVADTWQWPTVENEIYAKGVGFTNAMVPTSVCCPSRASILTGDFSHTTGVWANRAPLGAFKAFQDDSTLATWLQDADYQTGLFGKYLNGYGKKSSSRYVPPGWDTWAAFVDLPGYYGYTLNVNGSLETHGSSPADYSTDYLASTAADFIRGADPTQPVFAYWAPYAIHQPSVPARVDKGAFDSLARWRPPSYNEADVSDKPTWLRNKGSSSRAARGRVDDLRKRMHETLLAFDRGVGDILVALEEANRLDNTIVVVLSDNGYLWGEHQLFAKDVPYEAATRVPMALRWDAGAYGGSSAALVANVDVAPTIVDLAGIPAPAMDGQSLRPVLEGSASTVRSSLVLEHAAVPKGGSSAPSYCGIRTVGELYVRYAGGFEEYYRYHNDPWELRNQATRPARAARVASLRRAARNACNPKPPGFSW